MIEERVPAALAGERLDRVVALLADVSRSVAAATIAAGGVRVDGETATSGKVRLDEGSVGGGRPVGHPADRAADRRPVGPLRRSSSRTTTSWSSTSRPVWSSIPVPATRTGRWSTGCCIASAPSPTSATRCDRGSSTASTPAAQGCSSSPAPQRAAAALVEQFADAHRRTALRRRDVGAPERGARHRRRPDRTRPLRSAAHGGGGRRQAGADRVRGRGSVRHARLRWLVSAAACRPDARTRSASTWRRSVTRSSATPPTATGARRSGCRGRSCTPPSCPSTIRPPASGCR